MGYTLEVVEQKLEGRSVPLPAVRHYLVCSVLQSKLAGGTDLVGKSLVKASWLTVFPCPSECLKVEMHPWWPQLPLQKPLAGTFFMSF